MNVRTNQTRLARLTCGLAITCALAAPAAAQDAPPAETGAAVVDRSQPPSPGTPRPFTLPAVRSLELPNGLSVTLVDRDGLPTIAARLSVRAGNDASVDNIAVAHVTARTVRDGTAAWPSPQSVAAFIDGNGIEYGANVEANRATFSADALSNAAEPVLTLLTEVAARPLLADDRVTARRGEYQSELELERSQPAFHRNRLSYRVLFGDHPYAALYADAEAIAATTPERARAFHSETYRPNRARLVLVGDLPDDVDALLARTLGAWERGGADYAAPASPNLRPCNAAHVVVRPDSAQTSIAWLGVGVDEGTEGFFEALVANQVLGGGASARLFMNLREDKSYTYGAYSVLSELLNAPIFRAQSDVRSDVTLPALQEFLVEFRRLREEPVPADEVGIATSYLSGVFPIQLETNRQLADRLSQLLDLGLPADYLEGYRAAVTAISPESASVAGASLVADGTLELVLVGEEDVVIPAARAVASRVYVYDLDGRLVREEPGELPTTCAAPSPE